MPDEQDKSPQEQIKEGIWRIALQSVVILVAAAAGVFIGYQLWGDAPELKVTVGELTQQVQALKNDREAQDAVQAMCERDKKDYKTRLDKVFKKNNTLQRRLADLSKQVGE